MKMSSKVFADTLRYVFRRQLVALSCIPLTPIQVAFVEKDSVVHTTESPEIENNAPWGLSRISHRNGLTLGTVGKYLYSDDGGEGVDVYVIDTGTNVAHVDFEGRAHWGKTIPAGDPDEDGNGHGTHCSGTIAGKKYGVAKKANVYAVKVLKSNGSGSMSDVVKGVEWAAVRHADTVEAAKKGKNKKGFKGSTANMSLGGGKSTTLDLAVNAAVEAGIHFAVAAGNDNADSCGYSPARAENAVTVGASTILDERAYFSNYGKCNDIFAPGLNIQSAWIGSEYATKKISGTSMASPHIAGLLAYFLSLQPPAESGFAVAEITPKQLKKSLISIGTSGALTDVPKNTQNVRIPPHLESSILISCLDPCVEWRRFFKRDRDLWAEASWCREHRTPNEGQRQVSILHRIVVASFDSALHARSGGLKGYHGVSLDVQGNGCMVV